MRKGFLWFKKIIVIFVAMFCFLLCALPAFAYAPDSTYLDITADSVTAGVDVFNTFGKFLRVRNDNGASSYVRYNMSQFQSYLNSFWNGVYENSNIFADNMRPDCLMWAVGAWEDAYDEKGKVGATYNVNVSPSEPGGYYTDLHGIMRIMSTNTYYSGRINILTDVGAFPIYYNPTANNIWLDYTAQNSQNYQITDIHSIQFSGQYATGVYRFAISKGTYNPPPIPPNPPVGHDFPSFTSFDVPLSAGNTSFIYYEDIVNAFYSKSIDEKVLSHSYYPYITMQCVSTNSNNYIFVYFSDAPAVSNASIDANGNYSRPVTTGNSGLSGLAFVGYYPIDAPAGYDVEFIATSAYSGMGIQEIQTALSTSQPITIYDGHTLTGYVDLADIGSYENASASMYNICSNYSLTPNYLPDTVASNVKQSFKYPESWARLCLVAIEDDITGQAADRIAELMEELATYRDELIQTQEEFQQSVEDLKTLLEGNITGSLSSADVASIGTVIGSIMFIAGPLMPILTAVFLILVVMIIIKKGHG